MKWTVKVKSSHLMADCRKDVCTSCHRGTSDCFPRYYCFKCNEKLCEVCVRYHSQNRFLASHKLCEIDNVSENTEEFEYLNKIIKCKRHEWKEVKYLCKDHNEVCCNECAIVTHSKCKKLLSTTRDIEITDLKEFKKVLEDLESKAGTLYSYELKQHQEVTASENMVTQHLTEVKEKLDTVFFKFKERVLYNHHQMQGNLLASVDVKLSEVRTVKVSIEDLKKKLALVDGFGQQVHKVLFERELLDNIKQIDLRLNSMFDNASCEIITSKALNNQVQNALGCLEAENALSISRNKVSAPLPVYFPEKTEDQVTGKK